MPDVEATVARLNTTPAPAAAPPEDLVANVSHSWSFFMRKLSPLAGAAVLFAALGGFLFVSNGFDSNAAFAQAVRQFNAAQTMAFTMVTAVPGQDEVLDMRATVKNPGWMHVEFMQGDEAFSQVFDFQSQQMVMVMPGQKLAQRINMKGLPRGDNPNDLVAEFGRLDPDHATYLRDEKKDGAITHVYRIDAGPARGTMWIDAASKRPVRMEFSVVPGQKPGVDAGVTMKDFAWDVAVDDAKFSLAVPEGYQLREIDMSNGQPEDLALLLRIFAALSEEPFSADFGMESLAGFQGLMMDSRSDLRTEPRAAFGAAGADLRQGCIRGGGAHGRNSGPDERNGGAGGDLHGLACRNGRGLALGGRRGPGGGGRPSALLVEA